MVAVGCFLPSYSPSGSIDPPEMLGMAVDAERLGFDHVWVGDHYLWRIGILSPLPTLAAVATVTERIGLGTGVYLLNLRHPSLTAKDLATVDVLSGGRVILGAGVGGDDPEEYRAVGVEPVRKGARFEQTLASMQSLLAREGVASGGDLVPVPAFTMNPAPVQDPVPVWIGGRADVVVQRAARMAQGWFPVWVSSRRFAAAREIVAAERGSVDGFSFALNVFTALGASREDARQTVAGHLQTAYGLPFDTFDRYSAYGTADDIVEFLAAYVEAGATDIALNIAGPAPREQLKQLAEDVLPPLRAL